MCCQVTHVLLNVLLEVTNIVMIARIQINFDVLIIQLWQHYFSPSTTGEYSNYKKKMRLYEKAIEWCGVGLNSIVVVEWIYLFATIERHRKMHQYMGEKNNNARCEFVIKNCDSMVIRVTLI